MLMAFLFQQEGTVRGDLWGLTGELISGGQSISHSAGFYPPSDAAPG
jgi:hypothetical protein